MDNMQDLAYCAGVSDQSGFEGSNVSAPPNNIKWSKMIYSIFFDKKVVIPLSFQFSMSHFKLIKYGEKGFALQWGQQQCEAITSAEHFSVI